MRRLHERRQQTAAALFALFHFVHPLPIERGLTDSDRTGADFLQNVLGLGEEHLGETTDINGKEVIAPKTGKFTSVGYMRGIHRHVYGDLCTCSGDDDFVHPAPNGILEASPEEEFVRSPLLYPPFVFYPSRHRTQRIGLRYWLGLRQCHSISESFA